MTEELTLVQHLRDDGMRLSAKAADRIEADAATIASLREANKALTAEKARLEDELDEANRPIWPEWADQIRKCLMGYGVDPGDEWDLPAQFEDWLSGALEAETARATAAEAKLAKVEAEVADITGTLKYCEGCWADERGTMIDKIQFERARADRLSAKLAEARAETGKVIKQGFDRCADIAAERDRYKAGLQTLATTFYKEDQHQDYAKHVLASKEARHAD